MSAFYFNTCFSIRTFQTQGFNANVSFSSGFVFNDKYYLQCQKSRLMF